MSLYLCPLSKIVGDYHPRNRRPTKVMDLISGLNLKYICYDMGAYGPCWLKNEDITKNSRVRLDAKSTVVQYLTLPYWLGLMPKLDTVWQFPGSFISIFVRLFGFLIG